MSDARWVVSEPYPDALLGFASAAGRNQTYGADVSNGLKRTLQLSWCSRKPPSVAHLQRMIPQSVSTVSPVT